MPQQQRASRAVTQHTHSAGILLLCWFCHSAHPFFRNSASVQNSVTDRAGLRLSGLFTARKVQLLGLRRKGSWRKRQKTLSRRAHTPPLLFPLIHKTWREPQLPLRWCWSQSKTLGAGAVLSSLPCNSFTSSSQSSQSQQNHSQGWGSLTGRCSVFDLQRDALPQT